MKITIKHNQPALDSKYFDYLKREILTDCILVANGHLIRAHKIFLIASSTYFEQIFAILPAIVLFDVPHTFLSMILELIYCGKVEVNQQDILQFLKTLENLKIVLKNVEYIDAKSKQKILEESSNHEEPEDEIFYEETECNLTSEIDDKPTPELITTAKEIIIEYKKVEQKKISKSPPENRRKSSRTRVKNVVKEKTAKDVTEKHPDICQFCRKKAKSKNHVKYCINNPNRVISYCVYCFRSFRDQHSVKIHMRTIHKRNLT